jgi:hypothetical protein
MPAFSAICDMVIASGPSSTARAHGGLVVLLLVTVLSVHKPRGVTPYGWRKKQSASPSRTRKRRHSRHERMASAAVGGRGPRLIGDGGAAPERLRGGR